MPQFPRYLFYITHFLAFISCQVRANEYSVYPQADSIPGIIKSPGALDFIVVGDWGLKGSDAQKEVAAVLAITAKELDAKFIISTGDNFYDAGVVDTRDSQWHQTFENIYYQSSLQVPWYPVLGNHDYLLNPEAQIEYSKSSKRWTMPARYYFKRFLVEKDSAIIVFIDTDPMEKMILGRENDSLRYPAGAVERQLNWVESILGSSKAKWKIVVGHNPVHTGGARRHSSRTRRMRGILVPIFNKYGVDLYLSGHEHHLEYLKPKGPTHFIISGAASQTDHLGWLKWYRKFAARKKGFVTCSVKDDQIIIQFVDDEARILYQSEIRKQENQEN